MKEGSSIISECETEEPSVIDLVLIIRWSVISVRGKRAVMGKAIVAARGYDSLNISLDAREAT